jgi:hypothetical protein
MPRAWVVLASTAAAVALTVAHVGSASAQSVWSGLILSFSKANDTDPSLPENQDRITSNVWITRESTGGIFNIQSESFYSSTSPADTEWATDLNNPGDTIAATNWANLDFTSWIGAYGSMGGGSLPASLTSRNAVVHLITDDIYLDLRFTGWTQQGGGGFSYMRAVNPVPEPAAAVVALIGLVTFSGRRHRKC